MVSVNLISNFILKDTWCLYLLLVKVEFFSEAHKPVSHTCFFANAITCCFPCIFRVAEAAFALYLHILFSNIIHKHICCLGRTASKQRENIPLTFSKILESSDNWVKALCDMVTLFQNLWHLKSHPLILLQFSFKEGFGPHCLPPVC